MITFKEWEVQPEFEIYEIQRDGKYCARFLVKKVEGSNSTITFDPSKTYSVDDLAEIAIAIKHEFGEIKVMIGGVRT